MKSADLVLSMIVLTDAKSNNRSCCVGRSTDEEDPRNQGSSKFGQQVVVEELLEGKSFGDDNSRELRIPGSNE